MQASAASSSEPLSGNVKAILYNRILLFLALAGVFIAGTLSLAKIMDVVPPCGASSDCSTVTSDPSSMLFGVIPIAYIGFGAYLLLAALAILRSLPKAKNYPKLVLGGYLIAAGGTVISIGLQVYSILVIQALCKWCLSSAVVMTISVIVYALCYQETIDTAPEVLDQARVKASGTEFLLRTALIVVTVLGLAAMGWSLRFADHTKGRDLGKVADNLLIPANPDFFGDMKAPVKVIEFADLNCPACQKYSPMLKEFVRQHQGQICVIYRHFPLPVHKTSMLAAAIDEYASEKGKFWDYTLGVMGTKREIKDPNELFSIASEQGLDVNDLRRRLDNDKDPLYVRLNQDQNAANVLGIQSTPTFIVQLPNMTPKEFTGGGLMDAFNQKPYSNYLGAKK